MSEVWGPRWVWFLPAFGATGAEWIAQWSREWALELDLPRLEPWLLPAYDLEQIA